MRANAKIGNHIPKVIAPDHEETLQLTTSGRIERFENTAGAHISAAVLVAVSYQAIGSSTGRTMRGFMDKGWVMDQSTGSDWRQFDPMDMVLNEIE